MTDVNDNIDEINGLISPFFATKLGGIQDGGIFGAGFGLAFASGARVGLAYQRLTASRRASDPFDVLSYDIPANDFRATGSYVFESGRSLKGLLGGAIGFASVAGNVSLSILGFQPASTRVTGTGPSVEVFGGGEYEVAPWLGMTMKAGFHYARIREVRGNGAVVQNQGGGNFTIDYSGVFARAGLEIALTGQRSGARRL